MLQMNTKFDKTLKLNAAANRGQDEEDIDDSADDEV